MSSYNLQDQYHSLMSSQFKMSAVHDESHHDGAIWYHVKFTPAHQYLIVLQQQFSFPSINAIISQQCFGNEINLWKVDDRSDDDNENLKENGTDVDI